jgi:serine/threonine protein kinase
VRQPVKFGKYLLLERIAVGGMAEVFAAKAFGVEGFERLLAIKKILPTMGEDPEFISMFVDEARIAVQLSHANIVHVLELGKHDDSLYIAMEYISGRDLRQLLDRYRKRGLPMPVPQACTIVARVCEALDHAHRKRDAAGKPLGIVHRDVSPQNVLVSFEGGVKLIDFGIAKAETRMQRTQTGILKGKFSYMSPEQVRGQPIDHRSDVFAAGVLLWELLCGRKLFTGEGDFAVLEKVRRAEVPPPRSVNPSLPEGLEQVVLKALAAEPSDRYQWCSEMHDDLVGYAVAGETRYGSRQLAEWMAEEFRAELDKEQARMQQWRGVGSVPSRTQPQDWRVAPDADTLVQPPTPPARGAHASPPGPDDDRPTVKWDGGALARSERVLAAQRRMVPGAVATPPAPTQPPETTLPLAEPPRAPVRGRGLAIAVPGALLVLGVLAYLVLPPGKPKSVEPAPPKAEQQLAKVEQPPPEVPAPKAEPPPALAGPPAAAPEKPRTVATTQPVKKPARVSSRPSADPRSSVPSDGTMAVDLDSAPPAGFTPAPIPDAEPPLQPAEPARTVAAASPEPRFHIMSEPPGAQITIAGKRIGRTPLTTDVLDPARYYPLTASMDGYVTVRRAVKPTPGTADVLLVLNTLPVAGAQVAPDPQPVQAQPISVQVGYLVASTKPVARLTIDGRETGRWTPVPASNPIPLPAGQHTIVFETADGKRHEETLQIEPGMTARLERQLTP